MNESKYYYTTSKGWGWNVRNEYIESLSDIFKDYNEQLKVLQGIEMDFQREKAAIEKGQNFTEEELKETYNEYYANSNKSFEQFKKDVEAEQTAAYDDFSKRTVVRYKDNYEANMYYLIQTKEVAIRNLNVRKKELDLKLRQIEIDIQQQDLNFLTAEVGKRSEINEKRDQLNLESQKLKYAISEIDKGLDSLKITEEEGKLLLRGLNPRSKEIYDGILRKKGDPKKDDPKKDDPKKDDPKKDEPKKDDPKKDEPKKDDPKKDEEEDEYTEGLPKVKIRNINRRKLSKLGKVVLVALGVGAMIALPALGVLLGSSLATGFGISAAYGGLSAVLGGVMGLAGFAGGTAIFDKTLKAGKKFKSQEEIEYLEALEIQRYVEEMTKDIDKLIKKSKKDEKDKVKLIIRKCENRLDLLEQEINFKESLKMTPQRELELKAMKKSYNAILDRLEYLESLVEKEVKEIDTDDKSKEPVKDIDDKEEVYATSEDKEKEVGSEEDYDMDLEESDEYNPIFDEPTEVFEEDYDEYADEFEGHGKRR